jgi:putative ABC transport system permease protein
MNMNFATIPLSYNLRSIRARFTATIVAILGIAGVVAVFLAMLAMAEGFRQSMKRSGSPDNVMIRRAGSGSEMESAFTLDELRVIRDLPEIRKDSEGNPLLSAEVVAIVSLPQRATGSEANVQVRGINGNPMAVRPMVRLAQGRMFEPGKPELVVGKIASNLYEGAQIGSQLRYGGRDWDVVGIFDSGGSTFDSEIWADAGLTAETFNRPTFIFQSATLTLLPGTDRTELKARIESDPRLTLTLQGEQEYYAEKSEMMARMIETLGFMVVMVMGVGAVFAALNTMSATISARYREIATLRALGFHRRSIVLCFVTESALIALVGGLIGCLLALPFNGLQASTMNFDTFSHLGFNLTLTPGMMLMALFFAVLMGIMGGLIPATHASRQSIVNTLRGM